jgi:hypothetical protein
MPEGAIVKAFFGVGSKKFEERASILVGLEPLRDPL